MKGKYFNVHFSYTVSNINARIAESCLKELFRIYVHSNYDKGILWALEMGILFHIEGKQITWIKENKGGRK